MQIVLYVHRSGEGLPAHAKVLEVTPATADAVRATVHGAADELLNDIRAGAVVAEAADQAEDTAEPSAPPTATVPQSPGIVEELPGQHAPPAAGGGKQGGERQAPSRKTPSRRPKGRKR